MTEAAQQFRLNQQPLYAQVRAALVERLISKVWSPGSMLPSEFRIAEELGVSQGTVRKALDEMAASGLLVRKQGRGTFVAEAADNEVLFRFYRLVPNGQDGLSAKGFPESIFLERKRARANSREQTIFQIGGTETVWRLQRIRSVNAEPVLWEELVLPSSSFPDIEQVDPLPNNIYQLYSSRFGIIVAHVHEELRAVNASAAVAGHLGIAEGTALLEIDRRAVALDGQTIEWRTSLCHTKNMHYRNEL